MIRKIVVCAALLLLIAPIIRAQPKKTGTDTRLSKVIIHKSGNQKLDMSQGESIDWQTTSSGGGESQSDSVATAFLVGQTVIGESTNGQYTLYQGFGGAFIVSLKPDCQIGDVDGPVL